MRLFHSMIKIGILENDVWTFPSQLECHTFQVTRSCGLLDEVANLDMKKEQRDYFCFKGSFLDMEKEQRGNLFALKD